MQQQFLSQRPPVERVTWTFGHRPKRQKHARALSDAFVPGCKAPGFKTNNQFKGVLLMILAFASIALITGCGEEENSTPQALQSDINSFTFFEVGKTTTFSKKIRKELTAKIGRDASENNNLINLEINYNGFLQTYFPELSDLNSQLNFPAGERIEHNTFKLMYRYAKKKKIPFDYVELLFSNFSKRPILIRIDFKTDEANTVQALKTKYGEPAVIDLKEENGQSLYWKKNNDILVVSMVPDQFGRPRYQIMIYFTDGIRELVAMEQTEKAKKENLKSGKTAF